MNKFFFVSFASTNIKYALKRIGKQAKQFELFDKIYLYTEKKLPKFAKERCNEIISTTGKHRGYGYWTWKPIIINQVLSKMNDGDILIYSDAGSHLNPNGKYKLLNDYIPLALMNDIWVVSIEDYNSDINWTKIDTLNYFRNTIKDNDKLADFDRKIQKGQLESGTIILIKNSYTQSIMQQWEEYMKPENIHLFDDSSSLEPEPENFKENRHDQSILSLLLKSNHYADTPTEHFWSNDEYIKTDGGWKQIKENEPFMHLRDIHRKKVTLKDKVYLLFKNSFLALLIR